MITGGVSLRSRRQHKTQGEASVASGTLGSSKK